ncbi:hypothetical protein PR048_010556 [Dryococelus australis]|uniref:Uncharacterized protein n=1 Tax=Dryococelus australis TaxID=614101 RepID=A0ABQ9I320_9NEOP|nr:hypothetical protein PR048_010556 [Dryococelus australis]
MYGPAKFALFCGSRLKSKRCARLTSGMELHLAWLVPRSFLANSKAPEQPPSCEVSTQVAAWAACTRIKSLFLLLRHIMVVSPLNVPKRRVIDSKTARQFRDLRAEAMGEFYISGVQNSFDQATTLNSVAAGTVAGAIGWVEIISRTDNSSNLQISVIAWQHVTLRGACFPRKDPATGCNPKHFKFSYTFSLGQFRLSQVCGVLTANQGRSVSDLGDLPFPPLKHSGAAPYSPRFTLIGSQDLEHRRPRHDGQHPMKYKIDCRKPDRFCRQTSSFGLEIILILRRVVRHDAQNVQPRKLKLYCKLSPQWTGFKYGTRRGFLRFQAGLSLRAVHRRQKWLYFANRRSQLRNSLPLPYTCLGNAVQGRAWACKYRDVCVCVWGGGGVQIQRDAAFSIDLINPNAMWMTRRLNEIVKETGDGQENPQPVGNVRHVLHALAGRNSHTARLSAQANRSTLTHSGHIVYIAQVLMIFVPYCKLRSSITNEQEFTNFAKRFPFMLNFNTLQACQQFPPAYWRRVCPRIPIGPVWKGTVSQYRHLANNQKVDYANAIGHWSLAFAGQKKASAAEPTTIIQEHGGRKYPWTCGPDEPGSRLVVAWDAVIHVAPEPEDKRGRGRAYVTQWRLVAAQPANLRVHGGPEVSDVNTSLNLLQYWEPIQKIQKSGDTVWLCSSESISSTFRIKSHYSIAKGSKRMLQIVYGWKEHLKSKPVIPIKPHMIERSGAGNVKYKHQGVRERQHRRYHAKQTARVPNTARTLVFLLRSRHSDTDDNNTHFVYQLGSPLVDDRPIMNAVKYTVVFSVIWTNKTMVCSNTDTNRTNYLAVVDICVSLLIRLTCRGFLLLLGRRGALYQKDSPFSPRSLGRPGMQPFFAVMSGGVRPCYSHPHTATMPPDRREIQKDREREKKMCTKRNAHLRNGRAGKAFNQIVTFYLRQPHERPSTSEELSGQLRRRSEVSERGKCGGVYDATTILDCLGKLISTFDGKFDSVRENRSWPGERAGVGCSSSPQGYGRAGIPQDVTRTGIAEPPLPQHGTHRGIVGDNTKISTLSLRSRWTIHDPGLEYRRGNERYCGGLESAPPLPGKSTTLHGRPTPSPTRNDRYSSRRPEICPWIYPERGASLWIPGVAVAPRLELEHAKLIQINETKEILPREPKWPTPNPRNWIQNPSDGIAYLNSKPSRRIGTRFGRDALQPLQTARESDTPRFPIIQGHRRVALLVTTKYGSKLWTELTPKKLRRRKDKTPSAEKAKLIPTPELFCVFEAEEHGSDMGDTATIIQCAIATKRKALDRRAVPFSGDTIDLLVEGLHSSIKRRILDPWLPKWPPAVAGNFLLAAKIDAVDVFAIRKRRREKIPLPPPLNKETTSCLQPVGPRSSVGILACDPLEQTTDECWTAPQTRSPHMRHARDEPPLQIRVSSPGSGMFIVSRFQAFTFRRRRVTISGLPRRVPVYTLPRYSSGTCNQSLTRSLFHKQKRTVRIINDRRKSDSCRPLFQSPEILTFT